MNDHLWCTNTPENFWKLLDDIAPEDWNKSDMACREILGEDLCNASIEEIPQLILGEGQFGDRHFQLSMIKNIYYLVKPFLPRSFTRQLRKIYRQPASRLGWPIEDRYVRYLWAFPRFFMRCLEKKSLDFIHFWPDGYRYSFVITHDVETDIGQQKIRHVMDMEEELGFRSSFNLIPERYQIDENLVDEICQRGFEIGIHGLKHDGKLFRSSECFSQRAKKINRYIRRYHAAGFRTPLMQRQPEWMQQLDLEYDLSFFDTDPFEAISGGTMSIYPFQLGNFLELPYTLVQDYSLEAVLEETTPDIWLHKVNFIEKYSGMALVNVHPDYLCESCNWDIYVKFLDMMKMKEGCWCTLPRDLAAWWSQRAVCKDTCSLPGATIGTLYLEGDDLRLGDQTLL